MNVRLLNAADLSHYRELMLHAYRTAGDAFISTYEERAAQPESWWLNRIASVDDSGFALGAFDGEELVGSAAIQFSKRHKVRHKAHFIGMYVRESNRKRGIGEKLVQAVLSAVASRSDLRIITLTVTEGNGHAVALYERCGFQRFGVEPMAIETPDGYKAKVHMFLAVGEASAS